MSIWTQHVTDHKHGSHLYTLLFSWPHVSQMLPTLMFVILWMTFASIILFCRNNYWSIFFSFQCKLLIGIIASVQCDLLVSVGCFSGVLLVGRCYFSPVWIIGLYYFFFSVYSIGQYCVFPVVIMDYCFSCSDKNCYLSISGLHCKLLINIVLCISNSVSLLYIVCRYCFFPLI